MFGLETPDSDFDLLKIFIHPESAIEPSAKTTTAFQFPELNTEGMEVELATFMRAIRDRDLKYIEALHTSPTFIHPELDINPLVEYTKSLDLSAMFSREITRRYNKAWYREINPAAKNYNAQEGYDSKFAAHLIRVLISAYHYLKYDTVLIDFSYYRDTILRVRSGEITKNDTFTMSTRMKEQFEGMLEERKHNQVVPEMPVRWYFQTAVKFS